MTFFKGKAISVWIIISFLFTLLTIRIDATKGKTKCDTKKQYINDVYYELIADDECIENKSETIINLASSLFHSTGTSIERQNYETPFSKDENHVSFRRPRLKETVDITPTTVRNSESNHFNTKTATGEVRQNNPNADIQDIITGIVKLLNGNVNVHANTQYQPPTTLRRFATRINNRGPPRISDYQVIVPMDEKFGNKKSTPGGGGVWKPPTIPYPFDLPPPEKPIRNENTILLHNNKPIQSNRPPWHGSRTRPPIQVTNTNRMQMATRLPHQPIPDFRLSSTKTVNHIATFSTRIPDVNNPEVYPSESPMFNLMEQSESSTLSEKTDNESPKENENTTKISKLSSTLIIESLSDVPELSFDIQSTIVTSSMEFETNSPKTTSIRSTTLDETIDMSTINTNATQSTQEYTSSEVKSTDGDHTSFIQHTISPSRVIKPIKTYESTNFKSYYARPGIVLDDTDYTPGKPSTLEPSVQFHHHQPNTGMQSSATLSNIFAEVFDVTLSAIQGQTNSHHKVVDLLEIANSGSDVLPTKYNADGNDIIVSASDDNSFVSIDGKRTYINLFGETAETEHLKNTPKTQNNHPFHQQSIKTIAPHTDKTNSIPMHRKPVVDKVDNKSIGNHTTRQQILSSLMHRKAQQNAVRIDTCIVGDDTTCDVSQNEICKTDLGVSSCHCRPGYSRRKYRDPCRRVISFLMSMRIDKYYNKPIIWEGNFGDTGSEQFELMSYETMRAVDSVMSMTPFSDDFISARIHNMYTGNASQGSPGVYVNMTIQLDGNTESAQRYIQSDLQKELIAVIHRRNNNIGNSALYVDQPAGSISSLQDLDECAYAELNDCHSNANCTNTWGIFECKCIPGLRDPWSDQKQRAGRECISCSNSYCNNRGTCQYDESGTQLLCKCMNSFYGSQCEIDGEILAFSIGASIIAVLIITLTLICLVMWGRRWNQEQKEMIGSPIFNYITRANLDTHMKTMQSKSYQAALEDRMRWAQIADVMSQSNHYAVEPVAPPRAAPMYVYQNIHHPNSTANLTSLSMAGTLPVHSRGINELSIPVSRMDMESASKMRRHDNTTSSEEEDLVDLLGNTYQSPTGIYYDVDCESTDQQHGSSTLQSNLENGGRLYSLSNTPRVPMSTYAPNSRMYPRH